MEGQAQRPGLSSNCALGGGEVEARREAGALVGDANALALVRAWDGPCVGPLERGLVVPYSLAEKTRGCGLQWGQEGGL